MVSCQPSAVSRQPLAPQVGWHRLLAWFLGNREQGTGNREQSL
ncbi:MULTISPECIES: hypothetical protein [unclassified Moorena]|nr:MULTISPECIES: hypothetical protein [unclassified Moorena]